ncbi:class I SAM-dependent methyltransferase [Candidatus Methylacidithermus pantelleriae]|uniref:SAM-dependent methyltransferase n=1 Tax=Candidatus Methylacidithermus pantelleriae TaxID=2744239 RepID=A0A8J2BFK0_9BACT|nr:class I SAM-dependent methyltransferase [Candidatus Methylacidithermus pantelleriae]CAF0689066.1 SAM-dependent methyltransferase [Candidatus Methylacidithermus pantelleriae]
MLSLPATHAKVVAMIEECCPRLAGNYLDIGCGDGRLAKEILTRFPLEAFGCDRSPEPLEGMKVTRVDLNREPLPYPSGFFSLVTCTEVLEHLENYRGVVREVYRVLVPGGLALFSTPNVLNLRSRLRFLFFGFWNLFGPLPFSDELPPDTDGHISPVPCFYLSHALFQAGFRNIRIAVDRWQKGSLGWFFLLCVPIGVASRLALWRERSRYKTVSAENLPFVQEHNSPALLLGRTLVVAAQKPENPPAS